MNHLPLPEILLGLSAIVSVVSAVVSIRAMRRARRMQRLSQLHGLEFDREYDREFGGRR